MNRYEYRLQQIRILLEAFNGEARFKNEIKELEEEREAILKELKVLEE